MKEGLYVIYDKVMKEAGPIFKAKNDGVALRNYKSFWMDRPTDRPPADVNDYTLFKIAVFDSENMKFTECDPNEILTDIDVDLDPKE